MTLELMLCSLSFGLMNSIFLAKQRDGVSSWSFWRFCEAYEFASENGLEPPRANLPQFSLAVSKCEVCPTTQSFSGPQYAKQTEWYEEDNIELLCWEVLAKGFMEMLMKNIIVSCECDTNPRDGGKIVKGMMTFF